MSRNAKDWCVLNGVLTNSTMNKEYATLYWAFNTHKHKHYYYYNMWDVTWDLLKSKQKNDHTYTLMFIRTEKCSIYCYFRSFLIKLK